MEQETDEKATYILITECMRTLIKEPISSISDLGNFGLLSQTVSIVRNTDLASTKEDLTKEIEDILRDNFSAANLIDLHEVFAKNSHEIAKLLLLLIYTALMNDPLLRRQLLNFLCLSQTDEYKLKYFLENIQKRGHGMSKKYLDILIEEDLDGRELGLKLHSPRLPWSSPTIFTSSPKSTSQSPLRDLLHSPPFQMQKLLNERTKELKGYKQQVYALETDNQELNLQSEASARRHERLEKENQKLQERCSDLREQLETVKSKWTLDGDAGRKEMVQLRKENKSLKVENDTYQKELELALDEKQEYCSKLHNVRNRLTLMEAERDRLMDEVFSLRQASAHNVGLIESQATELREIKQQLEELEQHLLEVTKPLDRTIESFDGPSWSAELTATRKDASMSSCTEENLASVVVDKILAETKAKVESLESEVLILTQDKEDLAEQLQVSKGGLDAEKRKNEKLKKEFETREDELSVLKSLLNEKEESTKIVEKLEGQLSSLKETYDVEMSERIMCHEIQMRETQNSFDALLAEKEKEIQAAKASIVFKREKSLESLGILQQRLEVLGNEVRAGDAEEDGEDEIEYDKAETEEGEEPRMFEKIQRLVTTLNKRLDSLKEAHETEIFLIKEVHEENLAEMRRHLETLLLEKESALLELKTTKLEAEKDLTKMMEILQERAKSLESQLQTAKEKHMKEMAQVVEAEETRLNESRRRFESVLAEKEAAFHDLQTASDLKEKSYQQQSNCVQELIKKKELREAALTEKEKELTKCVEHCQQELEAHKAHLEELKEAHKIEMDQIVKTNEEELHKTRRHFEERVSDKEQALSELRVSLSLREEELTQTREALQVDLKSVKNELKKETELRQAEKLEFIEKEKENSKMVETLREELQSLESNMNKYKEKNEAELAEASKANEDKLRETRRSLEELVAEREKSLMEMKVSHALKNEEFANTKESLRAELKLIQDELKNEAELRQAEKASFNLKEGEFVQTQEAQQQALRTVEDELKRETELRKAEKLEFIEKKKEHFKTFETLEEKLQNLESQLKSSREKNGAQITELLKANEDKLSETRRSFEEILAEKEKAFLELKTYSNLREEELAKIQETLKKEVKFLHDELKKETESCQTVKVHLCEKEREYSEIVQALREELVALESQLKSIREKNELDMVETLQSNEVKLKETRRCFEELLAEKEEALTELKTSFNLKEEQFAKIQDDLQTELKLVQYELKKESELQAEKAETEKANEDRLRETNFLKELLAEKEKVIMELKVVVKAEIEKANEDRLRETNSLKELLAEKEKAIMQLKTSPTRREEVALKTQQSLQGELRMAEEKLEKERELHKTEVGDMKGLEASSQKMISDLRETVESLNAELKAAKYNHKLEMAKSLSSLAEREAMLSAHFEGRLNEKKRELEDVKKVEKECEAQIKSLRKELKKTKGESGAQMTSLQEDIEKLKGKSEAEIASLRKEMKLLERECEATSTFQEELKAEREKLSLERENLLKDIKAQEEALFEKERKMKLKMEAENIDREKKVGAAMEDVMRVERESEKTTQSLKEEIRALKEKSLSDKQAIMKMKTTYKTEIEAITEQLAKNEEVEKELQLCKQKYDIAKRKLKETLSNLTEAETEKEKIKKETNSYKDRVSKMAESLHREQQSADELAHRVKKLEDERQPLKDKVSEMENTCKRLSFEKRSLEAQLKMADCTIRDLRKQSERQTIGGSSLDLRSQGSRSTLGSSSSSNGDEFNDNSRTRLITDKTVKPGISFTAKRLAPSANKEQVFLKPTTRSSARLHLAATQQSASAQPQNPERRTASHSNLNSRPGHGATTTTIRPRRAVSAAAVSKKSVERVKALPAPEEKKDPDLARENQNDAKSLGRSVPREMMPFFNCEDEEEGEFNNHKYLMDLKAGHCKLDVKFDWKRVSELQRRNSLYPPHMRSAYPAEMQFQPPMAFTDDQLREGCAVADEKVLDLTEATEQLELNSPAFNLRKRKSLSDSVSSQSSSTNSVGRKSKRLSASYSRPGPPTPGRRSVGKSSDKENMNRSVLSIASTSSRESKASQRSQYTPKSNRQTFSPSSFRGSPSSLALRSAKGLSPANKKMKTPSILKIMSRAKSPWRKLQNDDDDVSGGTRRRNLIHRLRENLKSTNY